MRAASLAVLLVMSAAAGTAVAQDGAAGTAVPSQGVVSYPPEFFADARPSTASDMIERVPGFTMDTGANVRGFGGAAGNVLIDGERPSSKTDDLGQILRRIPASQVERIDLIRGGAPGIDMQGKTVLVNVIRRKGAGVTGVAAVADIFAQDGRHSPQVRFEGVRRKDGTVLEGSFIAAKYLDDGSGDGPRVIRDAAGATLAKSYLDTDGGGFQMVATGAYEAPLFGGKGRINTMLMHDRYTFESLDRPDLNAQREVEADVQQKRQGELGLHWSRDLGPRTSIELIGLQSAKTNDYLAHFSYPGSAQRFELNDKSGETIGRLVLHYNRSAALTLEGGGEVAFNWLESQTAYSNNGVPVVLPAANVRVEERRGEAFATASWRPTAALNVEAGLRVESSTISSDGDVNLEKTLVFAKPRVSATWSPTKADQFRFRAEREVGQLNFRDFVANSNLSTSGIQAGNPNLDPQQSWVVEAAYERSFWGKGSASLTLRHSEITDAIDRAPACSNPLFDPTDPLCPSVFDAPGNIGSGKEDDIEAGLSLPLDRFFIKHGLLRTSAIWRFSQVTDPTTGEERRISGQHAFDSDTHFTQDIPSWRSQWGVNVFTTWRERYYRFNSIDSFDAGTFVEVFGEYKPRPDFAIRLAVQNAGARPFTQTSRVYGGPRSTSGVDFVDRRNLNIAPFLYVRLKKTFG